MSIFASAPVPAGNRADTADTINLRVPGQRDDRRRAVDPMVELGRRVWESNFGKPNPLDDAQLAEKFGVTPEDLGTAVRAYLDALPDKPTGARKRRQTKAERKAEEAAWWGEPICPAAWWCQLPHGADDVHEMITGQLVGKDAACVNDPATVRVYLECDDNEQGPRISISITEGTEVGVPGFEGTQGWHGTPEQARVLAAALYKAANVGEVALGGTARKASA